MTRPRHSLCACLLGIVALAFTGGAGCTAGGDVKPEVLERAREARDLAVAAIAEVDAEIAKLPAGDPLRAGFEEQRAKLADAQRLADALLASAERGEVDPAVAAELGRLPVVGPYAGLIAMGLGWLWSAARARQRSRALAQVVTSVDRAFPDRTAAQKLALSAVQDEETRRLVDQVKGAAARGTTTVPRVD